MLAVKNLSKSFGSRKAVDNVNFCLHKGEIAALLGPNGAGKTTLLRLICGYLVPDSGEISVNHKNIATQRLEALQNIAYVPESAALYPEMTVFEYLKFIARLRQLSERRFAETLPSLVSSLGLSEVLNAKNEILSKGFRRRVALAGAFLSRPEILLLDEPTEGLDPNQKFEFRNLLKTYGRHGTVIISTHIMEEVEALADRILFISRGKLISDTTPAELKKLTPGNDIEAAFRAVTFEKRGM